MESIIDSTEQDDNNENQFLDYIATHPNAVVRFHASDIILYANTNVSYLNEPQARSCAERNLFLGIITS